MEERTIVGVFGSRDKVEATITDLRGIGIADSDISYVYSSDGQKVTTHSAGSHAGSTAAGGVATGAVLGALAGLAVANGILPGLGTLFVAGPLAAALGLTGVAATTAAGAMTGAAAGGLVGALVGLGVHEDTAKVYEERVRLGGILVTVQTDSPIEAREIFVRHGADEINEYAAA